MSFSSLDMSNISIDDSVLDDIIKEIPNDSLPCNLSDIDFILNDDCENKSLTSNAGSSANNKLNHDHESAPTIKSETLFETNLKKILHDHNYANSESLYSGHVNCSIVDINNTAITSNVCDYTLLVNSCLLNNESQAINTDDSQSLVCIQPNNCSEITQSANDDLMDIFNPENITNDKYYCVTLPLGEFPTVFVFCHISNYDLYNYVP